MNENVSHSLIKVANQMFFQHLITRPSNVLPVSAAATLALFSSFSVAQEADKSLVAFDPIVVTATRTEKPLSETASSLAVVSDKEIETRGYQSISEALLEIPNVTITSPENPLFSRVSIRGSDENQITYVIDGVRQDNYTLSGNRPTGIFMDPELVKQIERGIDHPVRTSARAVDLVDHDDGLQTGGKSLAGHKARLRHRAFNGVDQQQHAVDHRQNAFDFTAEVSVPRGVDDVDVNAFVFNGAVLGKNRDAAFLFQCVAVHHAFVDLLVAAESARALQKLVDHGRLAVVNVRNDGNIANCSSHVLLVPVRFEVFSYYKSNQAVRMQSTSCVHLHRSQ